MLEFIDPDNRIDFSSSSDTSDPKTIFVLRPMSGIDRIRISSKAKDGDQPPAYHILKSSIVEIKNSNIDDVEKVIRSLDIDVITELLNEVNRISRISDDDKKKS